MHTYPGDSKEYLIAEVALQPHDSHNKRYKLYTIKLNAHRIDAIASTPSLNFENHSAVVVGGGGGGGGGGAAAAVGGVDTGAVAAAAVGAGGSSSRTPARNSPIFYMFFSCLPFPPVLNSHSFPMMPLISFCGSASALGGVKRLSSRLQTGGCCSGLERGRF